MRAPSHRRSVERLSAKRGIAIGHARSMHTPRAVSRCALVVSELTSVQEVIATQIGARHAVVEELRLVDEAILCRDGQRKLGLEVFVLASDPSRDVSQLTLFPSASSKSGALGNKSAYAGLI